MFAVCRNQKFEKPHQLYADLGCPCLKALHPIADAIMLVKDIEERERKGIVPLRECRTEAPLG